MENPGRSQSASVSRQFGVSDVRCRAAAGRRLQVIQLALSLFIMDDFTHPHPRSLLIIMITACLIRRVWSSQRDTQGHAVALLFLVGLAKTARAHSGGRTSNSRDVAGASPLDHTPLEVSLHPYYVHLRAPEARVGCKRALTRDFSSSLVIMTIVLDLCSHTILQKSLSVSGSGPCVAM